MGVQGPRLRGAAIGPDRREQVFLGEDPGRVGDEDAEEGELFLRERDRAAVDGDPVPGWVDDEIADAGRAFLEVVATAQDGADASAQLGVSEGLDDVVVGTGVETADAVGVPAAAGEDNDRQARVEAGVDPVRLADLAQDVEAGGVRQRQVEQEQVTLPLFVNARDGQRGRRVSRLVPPHSRAGRSTLEPSAGLGLDLGDASLR